MKRAHHVSSYDAHFVANEFALHNADSQHQVPITTPAEPTAIIDSGAVIGTTTNLPSSTVTVNKFLGIPFAVSPPERFSPPIPVPKWWDPRQAKAFTSACMQQFVCMKPDGEAHDDANLD